MLIIVWRTCQLRFGPQVWLTMTGMACRCLAMAPLWPRRPRSAKASCFVLAILLDSSAYNSLQGLLQIGSTCSTATIRIRKRGHSKMLTPQNPQPRAWSLKIEGSPQCHKTWPTVNIGQLGQLGKLGQLGQLKDLKVVHVTICNV